MPRGKGKIVTKESPLAVTLPGEARTDDAVLTQAVQHINRLYTAKGLETARAIGSYVLETFFGSDPENFRKKGKKHVTFRKLAERDDLHVSYSFIWNAVAVVDQLKLLPENIAEALPLSHHRLLLPVRDPEKKLRLASEAVEKGLVKRQFEARVKTARAKELTGERRGRKPDPIILKRIKQLGKALAALAVERIGADGVEGLTETQVKEALLDLDSVAERMTSLRAVLVVRLGGETAG